MIFKKLFPVFVIFILSIPIFAQSSKSRKRQKFFVLATLHQFHAGNKYYSFKTLSQIIEELRPDILAVELTQAALASRREQKTKQEYQRAISRLSINANI